ncbi:MAG TPA: hypothetical protein ENN84_04110 [Candidatus Marinimicrobia bacterium]|nr:hypothetical protein [Candidatus Neomarinimicrobiota bacterium]
MSFNSQAESSQLDSLKQALIRQDGILTVAIEPEQGGVIICYDRFQTADKRILQIIHEVGMKENILEKRPWKQRD